MATRTSKAATLDAEIEALIESGSIDPFTISDAITTSHGSRIGALLAPYAGEFVAERARVIIHATRIKDEARASREAKKSPTKKAKSKTLAGTTVYCPNEDGKGGEYVPYGDLTADDFRRRAAMYERLAGTNAARGQWCHEVADLMDAEGAATFAALDEFPAPPMGDGLDEVLA